MKNLKDLNWFKINSECKYFFDITDHNQLKEIINLSKKLNKKIFILGEGSNILLNENLMDYIVIKFSNSNINILDNSIIEADSGLNFDKFIDITLKKNLVGLENFSLIPGNVGGVTFMNIHYKEFYLSDFIEYIDVFKISSSSILRLNKNQIEYSYTKNIFKTSMDYIIFRVGFKLEYKKDIKDNVQKRNNIVDLRKKKYPSSNTCGCFFYNIENLKGKEKSIGYQIEKLNIENHLNFNNVKIFEKHKNMFVTNDNCKSYEILELAKLISKFIVKKINYHPKAECRLIGFDDNEISDLV